MKKTYQPEMINSANLFRGCLFALPIAVVFWGGIFLLIHWLSQIF